MEESGGGVVWVKAGGGEGGGGGGGRRLMHLSEAVSSYDALFPRCSSAANVSKLN